MPGLDPLLSGLPAFGFGLPDSCIQSPAMAVLVTAIHAFREARKGVDARDKREHDVESVGGGRSPRKPDSSGLDPGIQRKVIAGGQVRWIAGSSPAMTRKNGWT